MSRQDRANIQDVPSRLWLIEGDVDQLEGALEHGLTKLDGKLETLTRTAIGILVSLTVVALTQVVNMLGK